MGCDERLPADVDKGIAAADGGAQRVGLLLLDADPADPLFDLRVFDLLVVVRDRNDRVRDLPAVREGPQAELDVVADAAVAVRRARGELEVDDVDDAVVVLDEVDEAQELRHGRAQQELLENDKD